jgi:hypothetical protein
MSKRSFLKPVALVAASIAVSAGHAYIPTPGDLTVKAGETTLERSVEKSSAMVIGDFIITQAEPTQIMAAHSSHASHASHASHSSHSSSGY